MIAGIDSGEKGAIAIIDFDGRLIDVMDMPFIKSSLSFVDSNKVYEFIIKNNVTEISIEEVRGIKGQSTMQSVFRQGGSYFPLGHACYMANIEPVLYDPKKWKAALRVQGSVGKNKKTKMFDFANKIYFNQTELFTGPRGGMLDGRTDAIGIALAHLKLRKK